VSYRVPHEGAGQISLVGPPNAGKSALLACLTHAHPEVAAYPFTTRTPQPGIMMWQDVPVQLVDLPPISAEFLEPWVPSIIRSTDVALLVADMGSDDVAEAIEAVLERLARPTPSWSEPCRTTSMTRRSGTSRRSWSPTRWTPTAPAIGSR